MIMMTPRRRSTDSRRARFTVTASARVAMFCLVYQGKRSPLFLWRDERLKGGLRMKTHFFSTCEYFFWRWMAEHRLTPCFALYIQTSADLSCSWLQLPV